MIADLTPNMTYVLSSIGTRSASASDLGVNGGVLKRLWDLGFLTLDVPGDRYSPAHYSLSTKGEGAAAILTSALPVPDHFETPIARIKRITAAHFRIPIEEMVSERRARPAARPRQVAMYVSKRLTPKSLPEIGRHFDRDHTTVIHAVRKVESLMSADDAFRHDVKTIMAAVISANAPYSVDKPRKDIADAQSWEA